MISACTLRTDITKHERYVGKVPIVLQKSFCFTEHNFSGPWAQRSNNHAGGYVNWR
jgi:hypothetical protein